MPTPCILIAEDNPGDVYLLRRALELANITLPVYTAADGEAARQFLRAADADPEAPHPVLILLDVNLPRLSGHEVMEDLRHCRALTGTPVIIVTSSDSPTDRRVFDSLGAALYFRKPSQYDEFMKIGELVRVALTRES